MSMYVSEMDCAYYVPSPIGMCGAGKIMTVCTPVKLSNRECGASVDLRGARGNRADTDVGCPSDSSETDVVSNIGADDACEATENV